MTAPRRLLPATLVAAATLTAGAATLAWSDIGRAQSLTGGHDSNAPVDYAADHIELQDKANRVVLSGNVKITQGDLTMNAPRTTVAYTNAGSLKIQRVDATGGVFVTRGSESARGDNAVYDFNRRIITMVGNVTLKRAGGDTLHSGRMVIDLKSGLSSTTGGPGGRVSGTFAAPN